MQIKTWQKPNKTVKINLPNFIQIWTKQNPKDTIWATKGYDTNRNVFTEALKNNHKTFN